PNDLDEIEGLVHAFEKRAVFRFRHPQRRFSAGTLQRSPGALRRFLDEGDFGLAPMAGRGLHDTEGGLDLAPFEHGNGCPGDNADCLVVVSLACADVAVCLKIVDNPGASIADAVDAGAERFERIAADKGWKAWHYIVAQHLSKTSFGI